MLGWTCLTRSRDCVTRFVCSMSRAGIHILNSGTAGPRGEGGEGVLRGENQAHN